jgi:glycosyltransferase involved in cell wall biosynthesis
MRRLIGRRQAHWEELTRLVDRFVALAPWVRDVLTLNGVPAHKIVFSSHGLGEDGKTRARSAPDASATLRVAHLGRLDPVKGTLLLVRAIRAVPSMPIRLDVYGVVQGDGDLAFLAQLEHLVGDDPRIRLLSAIDHGHVLDRLAEYDLVAVPSQWLETGPLVVLEAFEAGVPVIGSALGGIADKVRDGIDGLLVAPADSVDAWRTSLGRCAGDRLLMRRLRQGVRPARSMEAVAREMRAMYETLVSGPILNTAKFSRLGASR